MEQHNYALIITKIECLKSSAESGHDDVYLKVFPNGDRARGSQHFYDNALKMNGSDDSMRYADVSLNATYLSSVVIDLWDKDDGGNEDDLLATITINRDDPLEGSKSVTQTTWEKRAEYRVYWRIVSKPIPTLRVIGIMCQHSSNGCDSETIKAVAEVTAQCADLASEVLGHVKTPRAAAMSEAFGVVADYVVLIAQLKVFLQNVRERLDDVYLQHVDPANADDTGGAFCPPDKKYLKMDDKTEHNFEEEYGHYYRFPLDRGSVTVQIREGDMFHSHVSLGSITINDAQYNALKDQGATVLLAHDVLTRGNGQGAIYHLCYSVGLEDWALPATTSGQGYEG